MDSRKLLLVSLLPLAVVSVPLSALADREYLRQQEQRQALAKPTRHPLPEAWVDEFLLDPSGRLWAIFHYQGLAMLEGSHWLTYTSETSPLLDNGVSSVVFDTAGTAWIGTSAGLNSFDGHIWSSYTPENSGLQWENVSALAFDTEGRLWIASLGRGLTVYDGATWHRYPNETTLANAIAIDRDGRAWTALHHSTSNVGVVVFQRGDWTTYTDANSALPSDFVTSLASDAQGRVWIGTYRGVSVVDGQSWTTYTSRNSPLAGNFVEDIAVDTRGNVWLAASMDGISRYDGTRWTTYTYENTGLFPGNERSDIDHITLAVDGTTWLADMGGADYSLLSLSNLADVPAISPFLAALRPYTFSPGARWAIPFLLSVLFLAILLRVPVPAVSGIVFGLIPSILMWGGLTLEDPVLEQLNPAVVSAIAGPVLALIGGVIDLARGRLGSRQYIGLCAGFLGAALPACYFLALSVYYAYS